ncbi:MAG: serine--tRNA ligase [Patescibacteria group bacterium]|nr:serine--tRNA ligase [Patescibacteria group bacterium]
MLDVRFIRKNSAEITSKLARRGVPAKLITDLLKLDEQYRNDLQNIQTIRAEKNSFNKILPTLKPAERVKKLKSMSALSKKEKLLEELIQKNASKITSHRSALPNIPDDNVPDGMDEHHNKVIKTNGSPKKFGFKTKDYMQLAEMIDGIDTERASKVSGTRFGYLKGPIALLWNGVVQYVLDILLQHNFTPFYSPAIVKHSAMEKTGYDSYIEGQEAYCIEKDDLYLVGTGEHALLPYHSDEILSSLMLPLRYTTYSSCFRREAGSYGKDTKGILRVHQFDKQEMVVITTPEKSSGELNRLIQIQEHIVQSLGIPYHLLAVCAGELPKPSTKVIDLECWIPSENRYRETHSASNCTDYQARSNNIRYKDADGIVQYPHILNATAITPRIIIAILENNQTSDGTVTVPRVLHQYMRGLEVLKK